MSLDGTKLLEMKNTLVLDYLNTVLPGWVSHICESYSKDYSHLTRNWGVMCGKLGVSTQKILIVRTSQVDHKDIPWCCEILTRLGWVVRRVEELTVCEKCNSAIPTESVWRHLRLKQLPSPSEWKNKCVDC